MNTNPQPLEICIYETTSRLLLTRNSKQEQAYNPHLTFTNEHKAGKGQGCSPILMKISRMAKFALAGTGRLISTNIDPMKNNVLETQHVQ